MFILKIKVFFSCEIKKRNKASNVLEIQICSEIILLKNLIQIINLLHILLFINYPLENRVELYILFLLLTFTKTPYVLFAVNIHRLWK
jgi:hypothetical protein